MDILAYASNFLSQQDLSVIIILLYIVKQLYSIGIYMKNTENKANANASSIELIEIKNINLEDRLSELERESIQLKNEIEIVKRLLQEQNGGK